MTKVSLHKIPLLFRKFWTPNSLRFQLLSRSLFVMAALLLLIGIFQYVFMREFTYENKAASIQSQILSVPREVWDNTAANLPSGDFNRHSFVFAPDTSMALVDQAGNLLVVSNFPDGNNAPPQLSPQEYQNAMQMRMSLNYRVMHDARGVEQLVVLQPVELRGHQHVLVQVSTTTAPLKQLLVRQLLTFLTLALLALIVGLLAFLPVLKKTLVPLSRMVKTVEQIDAGNLNERFPGEQGQLEIDRLAGSFNGMLERLEGAFVAEKEAKEQMRRFVADASHELRTPLTSIHGFLEVLLRGAKDNPEQLQRALTSMYSESQRINKLVNDLLLLAKLDRAPHIELVEGSIPELIREMEPQLQVLAGNRQVSLNLTGEITIAFDPDKIKQVILNLFQNAVQHTDPEKGMIQLSVSAFPEGVELSVKDNGAGIPEEHLPHVFERFYRSESSRTRKSGGAGLGLSITKSIVDAHGGTIQVDSTVDGGSTFTVWLPK